VSISSRSRVDFVRNAQAEMCVDFAEIVCRFRQVFVGIWLRFGKSSPRWRIIGREEIKKIKRHQKSFYNSSGKITQRPKAKRSENETYSRPAAGPGGPARSTGVHKRARGSPVDRGKGTVDRHRQPTSTHCLSVCPSRDRRVMFSFQDSDSFSILGSNLSNQGFLNPWDSLAIKMG